jgi:hypothetical protein
VSTTVPFAGSVAEEIVFGPPSTSVSLVSTGTLVAEASSRTVALSPTAAGGSSTETTSIARVSSPVEPISSVALNVTVRGVVDGDSLEFTYVTARSAAW